MKDRVLLITGVPGVGKTTVMRRVKDLLAGKLDAACPVIATVAQRGRGFIAGVKRHPRAETWEVTRTNRDAMSGRIASWLDEERP